jgi:hypothetical protein
MVGDMGGRVSYRRDQRAGLTIFKVHLAVSEPRQEAGYD